MADTKIDPIGDEYYFRPLVHAERVADGLFYLSAALSLAALLVSRTSFPILHEAIDIVFPISVIAYFCAMLVNPSSFLSARSDESSQEFPFTCVR